MLLVGVHQQMRAEGHGWCTEWWDDLFGCHPWNDPIDSGDSSHQPDSILDQRDPSLHITIPNDGLFGESLSTSSGALQHADVRGQNHGHQTERCLADHAVSEASRIITWMNSTRIRCKGGFLG